MSFLAPWFWIGAAAIALPVVFHLVRQRIRRRQLFSSLMFLRPTPPKVKRRTRLEHLLLLALRCLLLLLLAAAFARPFFKHPPEALASRETGEIVVVLLDTSASMQRGSLWAEAVDRVDRLVDEVRTARQVSLLTFDRQLRTLISFDDWQRADSARRRSLWKERLQTARVGSAGTHLGKALVTAAELIEEARSREQATADTLPGRIIVIGDVQEGSHLEGLAGFSWPARLGVDLRTPPLPKSSNAGLHPVARDDSAVLSFSTTNEVRVFVSNASDATRELFQLQLTDRNGTRLTENQQVYLPAGQSRVVRIAGPTNAPSATRVVLSGDDEPFDNQIHLLSEEPVKLSIRVLGGDDPDRPASLGFFLRRAFQSTARQQIDFLSITNPLTQPGPDSPTDFLVAMDTPGIVAPMRRQLELGGAGLLVLNREATADSLRELCEVPSLPVAEGLPRGYALFGRIEFGHPLFAPFLDMRFSDFSRIHFWRYRKIDAAQLPEARVLAAYDSGDPALIELRRGEGVLYVLTSSWLPTDSQLGLSSKFVPLLYSMLELNHPPRPPAQERLVGEAMPLADIALPAVLTSAEGKITELPSTQTEVTFDQPGIHTLQPASGPPVLIAVNLDPAESRTGPLNEETLIRIGVPLHADPTQISRALASRLEQQKDSETENQQKNWRWLLGVAAAIFLVESWLAGRAGRTAAESPTGA